MKPLEAVRVLDLSRVLAGPFCTMMLGDLGADVIKIERPGRGDDTRGWGPPFDARGESAYFLSTNRNKLSVALDLSDAGDRTLLLSLVRDADVVVENFLPGALERVGIVPDDLLRQHQRLLWCSITGFGRESMRPGYDFVVQAESGWMAITGDVDGDPVKTGVALADVLAGKDAALAIVAALFARNAGRGAPVERRLFVSLLDSARAALVNVAQNTLVSGADALRWGNAHANLVPYQLFRAADRPIVIAVGTDEQWRACVRVMGLADLERDPALASNAGRLAHRDRVVRAFEQVLRRRTASEWIRALGDAGVPCGMVRSVLEVVRDASGASPLSGMPSSVPSGVGSGGAAGDAELPPPRLDEHGALVRRSGWDAFRTLR